MPKMKTKSGAKKRFIVRASGSIKRSQAFKRHILTKKTTKSKRQLRGMLSVNASDGSCWIVFKTSFITLSYFLLEFDIWSIAP